MNNGMKPLLRTALTLLFIGSLAAPARADWFLTPYIGAAFGGASNQFVLNDLDDEFEQRVNFGGSFGWRSKGIFGVEVDYNVAPNFFQFTGGTNNFDLFDFDSSVQTLMGNVVIAIPIGGSSGLGFHPYLTAGLGTIRTQLRSDSDVFDDITSNDTRLQRRRRGGFLPRHALRPARRRALRARVRVARRRGSDRGQPVLRSVDRDGRLQLHPWHRRTDVPLVS